MFESVGGGGGVAAVRNPDRILHTVHYALNNAKGASLFRMAKDVYMITLEAATIMLEEAKYIFHDLDYHMYTIRRDNISCFFLDGEEDGCECIVLCQDLCEHLCVVDGAEDVLQVVVDGAHQLLPCGAVACSTGGRGGETGGSRG